MERQMHALQVLLVGSCQVKSMVVRDEDIIDREEV